MCKKPTILVIDDEPDITRAMSVKLRAYGYDVLISHDGVDGLKAAEEHQPDAIILDVRMPKMDGLTTLVKLTEQETTQKIPVVMVSASIVDRQAALGKGARYFLEKPYDAPTLLSAIENLIEYPSFVGDDKQ